MRLWVFIGYNIVLLLFMASLVQKVTNLTEEVDTVTKNRLEYLKEK